MNAPVRCSYAACGRQGEHFEPAGRWWFCGQHYTEHLALRRQEATKDCASCFLPFTTTDTRRTLCNACKRFRKDTRPTYRRRSA